MDQAYKEQDDHPAIEGPCLLAGILKLDAECHSEQQGKEGIELTIDEERLESPGHLVRMGPSFRIRESP